MRIGNHSPAPHPITSDPIESLGWSSSCSSLERRASFMPLGLKSAFCLIFVLMPKLTTYVLVLKYLAVISRRLLHFLRGKLLHSAFLEQCPAIRVFEDIRFSSVMFPAPNPCDYDPIQSIQIHDE